MYLPYEKQNMFNTYFQGLALWHHNFGSFLDTSLRCKYTGEECSPMAADGQTTFENLKELFMLYVICVDLLGPLKIK